MRGHLQQQQQQQRTEAVNLTLDVLLSTRVLLGHMLNDDPRELRDYARKLAIQLQARDIRRAVDALRHLG